MHLSEFDYALPAELIAQRPLAERDASRMMVLDRADGTIQHRRFRELPDLHQCVVNELLVSHEGAPI